MTKRKTAAVASATAITTPDPATSTTAPVTTAPTTKVPRPHTKMAALVAVLHEPNGATIPQMQAITGWQEHSVRGALAGALKRKFGLTIVSAKEERDRGRCQSKCTDFGWAPA